MGKFHDEAASANSNWWRISGWESFKMKLRVLKQLVANFWLGKFHDEAESANSNWWRISGWESFMMKLRVLKQLVAKLWVGKFLDEAESINSNWWRISGWESFMITEYGSPMPGDKYILLTTFSYVSFVVTSCSTRRSQILVIS